jgi:hypothetical protein
MSVSTFTIRLPGWLDAELREEFARNGEGPSAGLRRVVEEWWVRKNLPFIEFRPSLTGHRPAMKEGPELWAFIMAWKEYGDDFDGLNRHFGGLPHEAMEQAIAYYRLFPDSIDEHLRENERLERFLIADPT